MKMLLLGILAMSIGTMGCKEEQQVVAPPPTLNELVVQDAHIVQDAAEAFAAQSGGYPQDVSELLPFLPDGELLVNHYLGWPANPVDGAASNPGEISYAPSYSATNNIDGYRIYGYGELDWVVYLFNDPQIP